jgi:hypothetical protein
MRKIQWSPIISLALFVSMLLAVSTVHALSALDEAVVIEAGTLQEAAAIITIRQIQGKASDLSKVGMLLTFTPNKLINGVSAERRSSNGCANVACGRGIGFGSSHHLEPTLKYKKIEKITYNAVASDRWSIGIPIDSIAKQRGDYKLSEVTLIGGDFDGMGVRVSETESSSETPCSNFFIGKIHSSSPIVQLQYQGKRTYASYSGNRMRAPPLSIATSSDCSRVVLDPLLDSIKFRPDQDDSWSGLWTEYSEDTEHFFARMSWNLSHAQKDQPHTMRYEDVKKELEIIEVPNEFWKKQRNGWLFNFRKEAMPIISARLLTLKGELIAVEVRAYVLSEARKSDHEFIKSMTQGLWNRDDLFATNYIEKHYYYKKQLRESFINRSYLDSGPNVERYMTFVFKGEKLVAYKHTFDKNKQEFWYSHYAEVSPKELARSWPKENIDDLLADQEVWQKAIKQYGGKSHE